MSGLYHTVEESIGLNLMRYFGINKIESFINHRGPLGPLTSDAVLTAVTDKGNIDIEYNKINIAALFGGYDLIKNEIYIDGPFTFEELITLIANTYNVLFTADTFNESITTQGIHTLTVKDTDHYYKGSITISVVDNNNIVVPTPYCEWWGNGNKENTGTVDTPFEARLRYVTKSDQQFMFMADNGPQRIGTVLDATGDWTLDFEINVSKRLTDAPIFTGNEDINRYGEIGIFNGYLGERNTSLLTGARPDIPTETTQRYTLICSNGIVTCYLDKKQISTWKTDNARRPNFKYIWTYQNGPSTPEPGTICLRAIRFYEKALSDKQVDVFFAIDNTAPINPVAVRPIHEWRFEKDCKNTGEVGGIDINCKVRHVEYEGHTLAEATGDTWITPIDNLEIPGLNKIPIVHAVDYVYRHDMASLQDGWDGIFQSRGVLYYGASLFFNGECLLPWLKNDKFVDRYQVLYRGTNSAKMNTVNRLMLVKEKTKYEGDCIYHSYVNGVKFTKIRLLDKVSSATYNQFGLIGNNSRMKPTSMLANLQIYDEFFTDEQVAEDYANFLKRRSTLK